MPTFNLSWKSRYIRRVQNLSNEGKMQRFKYQLQGTSEFLQQIYHKNRQQINNKVWNQSIKLLRPMMKVKNK